MTSRIAVLASGRGSNLRVLLDYFSQPPRRDVGAVTLVASDKSEAGALDVARAHAVQAHALEPDDEDGSRLHALFREHDIDLVVLAGFLRLVPPAVVRAYEGRMVNVHPALLPAFGGKGMYGARVHRAVLEAGVRVSGPTVHYVDELYDHGAIIAQWPVPVFEDDSEQTLAARVLHAEHRLLPRVVHALCAGIIRWNAAGVRGAAAARMRDDGFVLARHTDLDAAMDRSLGLDTLPGPEASGP